MDSEISEARLFGDRYRSVRLSFQFDARLTSSNLQTDGTNEITPTFRLFSFLRDAQRHLTSQLQDQDNTVRQEARTTLL
jgi:hypothetical protein